MPIKEVCSVPSSCQTYTLLVYKAVYFCYFRSQGGYSNA